MVLEDQSAEFGPHYGQQPTLDEFKSILANHRQWLANSGKDTTPYDLRGIVLADMDLSPRSLGGILNLTRADLTGADLSRANLTGADLSRAKLNEADLQWSVLCHAKLEDADLSKADLARADLSDARLKGAKLVQTDLRGANINRTDLRRTSTHLAKVLGLDLTKAMTDGSHSAALLSRAEAMAQQLATPGPPNQVRALWQELKRATGGFDSLRLIECHALGLANASHWLSEQDPALALEMVGELEELVREHALPGMVNQLARALINNIWWLSKANHQESKRLLENLRELAQKYPQPQVINQLGKGLSGTTPLKMIRTNNA